MRCTGRCQSTKVKHGCRFKSSSIRKQIRSSNQNSLRSTHLPRMRPSPFHSPVHPAPETITLMRHHIIENVDEKLIRCYLFKLSNGMNHQKSSYGCAECGMDFHLNCSTAFHSSNDLKGVNEDVPTTVRMASLEERRKNSSQLKLENVSTLATLHFLMEQ